MKKDLKKQELMKRNKQIERGELTLRLWAVSRVSYSGQGSVQFGSLEQQKNMIQRWADNEFTKRGVRFEITKFIEVERSGRKEKVHLRKDLQEIRRAMLEKKIDGVIFEKIDRITRSKSDFFELVNFANKHGCQIFTIEDGDIDPGDRGKSLMTSIKVTMAEDYSNELAEKVSKKQREAKVNNCKDSSTKPVLGLNPDSRFRGFYEINYEEQLIVLDIFNFFNTKGSLKETVLYCQGRGYKTKEWWTAEKFNRYGEKVQSRKVGGDEFDSKRLRDLLSNDKYLGRSSFVDHFNQFPDRQDENGRVAWSYKHGPVVPEKVFLRAQELLEKIRMRHVSASSKRVYLLSGILTDVSGSLYQGYSVKRGDYLYYRLKEGQSLIPKDEIERVVVGRLKKQIADSSTFKSLLRTRKKQGEGALKNLQIKLTDLRERIIEKETSVHQFEEIVKKEILNKPEDALKAVSALMELQDKNRAEFVALKDEEAVVKKEIDLFQSSVGISEVSPIARQFLENFDKKDDLGKRMILQSLIKRVKVHSNSKLEIVYSESLLEESRHSGETSVRLERKWRERRDSNPRPSA